MSRLFFDDFTGTEHFSSEKNFGERNSADESGTMSIIIVKGRKKIQLGL